MNLRVLVFFLSLVLFLLPVFANVGPVASQEDETPRWGSWSGDPGQGFQAPQEQVVLCVRSDQYVEITGRLDGQARRYRFEPREDAPVCARAVSEEGFVLEEGEGVRVALMRTPPRILERPGVTPLPEEGGGVLVQGVSEEGSLMIAPGGAGIQVDALAWPSLRSLRVDQEASQLRVQVPVEGGVLVVVVQDGPQQALLRWSDPGWFPVAPDLGQVLAPVALALLVALFRGGAGGPWVRPGAAKKRRGGHQVKGMGKEEGPDGPSAASGR